MTGQTPTRRQLIAQEIREFLLSLPLAKHSPMGQQTDLADGFSLLAGIVKRLKAFINFLSKLNSNEYLRWMHNAFSSKIELSPDENFGAHDSYEEETLDANTTSAYAPDIEHSPKDPNTPDLTPTSYSR